MPRRRLGMPQGQESGRLCFCFALFLEDTIVYPELCSHRPEPAGEAGHLIPVTRFS